MRTKKIGYLITNENKKYSLTIEINKKERKLYAYIGNPNSRLGFFFRFNLSNNIIHINPNPRNKEGRTGGPSCRRFIPLMFPYGVEDISQILKMILSPYNFKEVHVEPVNRKQFSNILIAEMI